MPDRRPPTSPSAPPPGAKPRVLWVYDHANTIGGSLHSVLDLLRHFDRSEFDALVALPAPGDCAQRVRALDLPVCCQPSLPASRSWRYLACVFAWIRLLRQRNVDLLYCVDHTQWRAAALTAANLLGIPAVVHVRSPVSHERARDPSLSSAWVVGNSRASLRNMQNRIPERRTALIYNFVDFDVFQPGPDLRERWFGESGLIAGFLGMFRPEKGIAEFIDAARIVRGRRSDIHFVAIGDDAPNTSRSHRDAMKRYAQNPDGSSPVQFVGFRDDVAELLRSLDVLVVPSHDEGFGRVILEANAVGVPVIGADAAGIPEVIEPGATGCLVPVRNATALAAAILHVMDDEGFRQRVADTAPQRVRMRFDPARQIGRLHEVWRQALSTPRG